jgi:hypothetical protein
MSIPDIEGALISKFDTLGYSTSVVAYPNGPSLDPAITTLNYSLTFLYADAVSAGLGIASADRHHGLFQITIRAPKVDASGNPAGTYTLMQQVKAINTAFKKGTSMGYPVASPTQYVRVTAPLTMNHFPKAEDGWYIIVLRIPFEADVLD